MSFHDWCRILHHLAVLVCCVPYLPVFPSSVCDSDLCFPVWPGGHWCDWPHLPERPVLLQSPGVPTWEQARISLPLAGISAKEAGEKCLPLLLYSEYLLRAPDPLLICHYRYPSLILLSGWVPAGCHWLLRYNPVVPVAGFTDGVLVLRLQEALQPFQLVKLLALCRPGANGHCVEAGWFNSLSCVSMTEMPCLSFKPVWTVTGTTVSHVDDSGWEPDIPASNLCLQCSSIWL